MNLKEQILEQTDGGFDFFKFVIKELNQSNENQCYNVKNPFYNDKRPSLSIYYKIDRWQFHDYGDSEFTGDVFDFAAHYYSLDVENEFPEILSRIIRDIELKIEYYDNRYAVNEEPFAIFETIKENTYQFYIFKDDDEKNYKYWQKYGISISLLKEYNVYPISHYTLYKPNEDIFDFKGTEENPIFLYYSEDGKYGKLYQPNDSKLKFMWLGKKPKDFCFGIDKLNNTDEFGPSEKLIITGGEKDVLTLASLGYDAICFNSETANIPEYIIEELKAKYLEVSVLFDNDDTGKKRSNYLCKKHNLRNILLPVNKNDNHIKDVSDFVHHGIDICPIIDNPIDAEEKFQSTKTNNEESEEPPFLSAKVFDNLPSILNHACSYFNEPREKDVFLLGSLGVISGCFPNVYGVYDKSIVHANLFLFYVAPPASGKSVLKWSKYFGYGLHERMHEIYKQELTNYTESTDEQKDKSEPEPIRKILFIPANSSSTVFIESLNDNEGNGIMFETEADTLSSTLKQDWGDYSDSFRRAFHHETISYKRRLNKEYVEINNPSLSIVLSGTPGQVTPLINSIENGLFSRFLFYSFDSKPQWRNVFESGLNLEADFTNLGEDLVELFEILTDENNNEPIEFRLTETQQQLFNQHFFNVHYKIFKIYGPETLASVRRLALMTYRISMTLSILRLIDKGEATNLIICDEIDFELSIEIAETLIEHMLIMYDNLPKQNTKFGMKSERKHGYFSKLPDKFNRKEADSIAVKTGIKLKTAEKYLSDFVKAGLIEKPEHNSYIKV